MSAQFALPQIEDGLEKLLILATLRKEDIAANAAETRKQIQLTNEELGKAAEAKAYIAKHASLVAEIQAREDALAQSKKEHEDKKTIFAIHVDTENTRLETYANQLAEKEKQQSEITLSQRAEAERLAGLEVELHRQHQDALNALQEREAAAVMVQNANLAEKERLATVDEKLRKKAKRLKEATENIEL